VTRDESSHKLREGQDMNRANIEIRTWPPGAGGTSKAVIALHVPTGAAAVVSSESSREHNQKLAVERVHLLLNNLPWNAG
jgi:hypothetical protein